jgi:hypothetical protein
MSSVQGGVPRKPSGNDSSVAIRIPDAWLKRAEALREFLASRPGIELTKSDILRICIARGLEAIEAERDAAAKPSRRK